MIIGIAGKKGSGKDAVCNCIGNRIPNTKRIAFADALKDEVCIAMHVSREYLEDHKSNFRLILQGWGTDYRRKLHGDDYWLRQWMYRYHREPKGTVVIVPDVRFKNEALLIHGLDGIVFHVDRHTGTHDQHESETELDSFNEFDRQIDNRGSLIQLQTEVDIALDMCHLLPTQTNQ